MPSDDTIWAVVGHKLFNRSNHGLAKEFYWDNSESKELYGRSALTDVAVGSRGYYISSRDGILRYFTANNGLQVDGSWQDGEPIHSVAINSTETLLAYGMDDGRVAVRTLPDGKLQFEIPAHHDTVHTLSFNPHDPNMLVTGSLDGAVHMWSLTDGGAGRILSLESPAHSPVNRLSFNPGRNELAVLFCNETGIRIWDLQALHKSLEELQLDW